MRQKEAEHILPHEFGEFASEHDIAATQMRLDLIESGLDGPTLRVEPRELERWRLARIENVRDQTVGLSKTVDSIVHQANQNALSILTPMLGRGVKLGQVRSV